MHPTSVQFSSVTQSCLILCDLMNRSTPGLPVHHQLPEFTQTHAPTKRQRLAEWIQKQDPYICCLQETHLKTRDTYRLKVKGWKKIFHANRDQKKAGVAILISDKIDFKTKAMKRDKEAHYIMIKGLIQEEDITIINIYTPNIGAP